ncbi:MAG: EAL domain-containing protein [Holosporaceae bacterium]|jgi:EAL domain-containing protein (putative c-di-GMP-specific phosphodiesterase class I)|nr:EAL domain-containing protein [Holosporaceae bacterium]
MINKIRLQPLVKLSDNSIYGYEALYKKEPSAEYPSASKILNSILCNHKDKSTCKCHNFKLFINLTVQDIEDASFGDSFLKVISDDGIINENNIVVEINENTSPGALFQAKETINILRDYGIKIALDDFGSQDSCLSFMGELPIDIVKIDKKFIQSAPLNKKAQEILMFIIQVSHDIGCEVVVEGIENTDQLACAEEFRADIGQGFLFAPQLPSFNQTSFIKQTTPFINLREFDLYISKHLPSLSIA